MRFSQTFFFNPSESRLRSRSSTALLSLILCACSGLGVMVTAETASAQTLIGPMSRSGVKEFNVPAGYASRDLITYMVVSGRVSQTMEATLDAPAGAILQAETMVITSRTPVSRLATSRSGWVPMRFLNSRGGEASSLQPVSNSISGGSPIFPTSPGTDGPDIPNPTSCGGLTSADIERIIRDAAAAGVPLTAAIICQAFGQSGGVYQGAPLAASAVSYQTIAGRMLLRKDTCSLSNRSRTLIRFRVNLSRVNPAARAEGFRVRVAARVNSYRGKMAAALKPLGEGRYKQPLFLMSSLIGYGQQKLTIAEWRSRRIARMRSVRTADFVYHRGQLLTRTPAGRFMSGNRAAVEISNGSQMYSVCFQLHKRRQNVNGYRF